MLSVIIPVYDSATTLVRCLEAVAGSDYTNYECIVVDDSSTDGSAAIAQNFSVRLLELRGGPFGPAHARNRGAEIACGQVLFFLDADVLIANDTISKVVDSFASQTDYDAVFGSYDDAPEAKEFLSQFKNLFHHYVHQQGNEDAVTFWSGCGAIRRAIFLKTGGFDEARYPRPSIEDIELGNRLIAAGHKIRLEKAIQVKHLKRWSLAGMLKSDIFDRAIPWTRLVLERRHLPNDLNLQYSQRLSALLICITVLHLGLAAYFHNLFILPLLVVIFLLVVGAWHWYEGPVVFKMDRWMSILSLSLLGLIGWIALQLQALRLLPPLLLLFAAVAIGTRLSPKGLFWRQALIAVMVLATAFSVFLLFSSYPIWLAGPIVLILAVVITLNVRLYAFFARKRGIVFTLAAIPIHLMYFSYSSFAFAVGFLLHVWSRITQRQAVSSEELSDPLV